MKRKSPLYRGVFQRCKDDCPADKCTKHTWSFEVELPGRNGKRTRIAKAGFAGPRAADQARAAVVKKHKDGQLVDDQKLTVAAWLDRWLQDRERDPESAIRATTATGYRTNVEKYWRPKLGHIRLRDLRRDHVSSALGEIVADRDAEIKMATNDHATWLRMKAKEAGEDYDPTRYVPTPRALSRSTVSRIRATLSSALGDAVDAGLIAANPATQVRLRKGKRRAATETPPLKAWGAEEVATFLDAVVAEDHPLAVAFHLAALHGLRRGELLGLRWSSVDLDAGTLTVEHTRTATGYKVVEGTGKSEHSRATVALDAGTATLLRTWKARQAKTRLALGDAWRAGDLVFVREDGVPWHPDRVSKLFAQAVQRHGLPRISLHGLRHTSASVQIASGVPIEVVSKRLRHAHVTITSGVYSHLVGNAGREAADAVANAVGRYRAGGAQS